MATRDHILKIRITADERLRLEVEAESQGRSVSDYCRRLILPPIRRVTEADWEPVPSGIPELDEGQGRIEAPKREDPPEPAPASLPERVRSYPTTKDCTAYAPRGTRCKICGKVHS